MSPDEIRAIRGTRTRAALARLLGVTPLTVLRWELPESDKEARRPRSKTIDALRKLEAGELPVLPETGDFEDDEALLAPLLARLWTKDWARVEGELVRLLASPVLSSVLGRMLAALGVAQAQLASRFDSLGGLMTLLPILAEAEAEKLPPALAGRAFALAACAFCIADPRTFDAGRANASAARAEKLVPPEDHDMRVLITMGRLGATRFLAPSVALRAYESMDLTPHPGLSPLAHAIAVNMHTRVRNVHPGAAPSLPGMFANSLVMSSVTLACGLSVAAAPREKSTLAAITAASSANPKNTESLLLECVESRLVMLD